MKPYQSVFVAAIILFEAEVLVGAAVPMFWNVKGMDSIALQCVNCFAGGILFTCGLLSMLGSCTQELIDIGIYYPLSYFLALITFFVIFAADKLFGDEFKAKDEPEPEPDRMTQLPSQVQLTQEQLEDLKVQRTKTGEAKDLKQKEFQKKDLYYNIEINFNPSKKTKFPISTIILMFALFLDMFLEGLALGLQKSMDGIIQLSIGLLTFQWSESLLLGLNLKKKGIGKLGQLYVQLPIIIAGPIGAGVGYSIAGTDPLIEGLLLSAAAGAFFYVSTFEMFFEEIQNKKGLVKKFLSFYIGIILILALSILGSTGPREKIEEGDE